MALTAQRPFKAYDRITRKIFRFLAFSSPLLRSRRAPFQVSNRTVGDSMSHALRSVNQEVIGMKLGAMYLRTGCVLPHGLEPTQKRFSENWMSVENATAATLDVGIRNAGWHFMFLHAAHSRLGIGRTAESATTNAMTLALKQTEGRFNAAELGLVKVTRFPGFYVARATLHTRQIQQHASLGLVDEMVLRQIPAR